MFGIFFFKQKTAYEMRISDWSSDVCSSDLEGLWPDAMAKLPASGVGKRQLPAVGQKHSRSASRRNALLSATSTGGPAPGQRSIVAGNLRLPFVPLLRFNRQCGNGAGVQSSERDWLAGDFAIAIFAIVNPAQRRVDFLHELALASSEGRR